MVSQLKKDIEDMSVENRSIVESLSNYELK